MPFTVKQLKIKDVLLITTEQIGDKRGYFLEVFNKERLGIEKPFTQVNQSSSQKNVVRGLHYQLNPHAQAKLVHVIRGAIYDVAVDIRKNSPTYGQWVAQELSTDNRNIMYVPEGFAHGFSVLSDEAEILYFCTSGYAPQHERGILWNDPDLAIEWPITDPILSEKDINAAAFKVAQNNFVYGRQV